MPLHYLGAARIFGGLIALMGVFNLVLGARGFLQGGAPSWPHVIIGIVALAVGGSIVVWTSRAGGGS